MRKKISLLILLVFSFLSFYVSVFAEEVDVKGEGDQFLLSETAYQKNQGFVFTAKMTFKDGQAGGLVFGGVEDQRYWVFNFDRYENKVKLLYFEKGKSPLELRVDWYIGNDKITEHELALVNPRVRAMTEVLLKVVLTPSEEGVLAEFYADGIRRFGVDTTINLDQLKTGLTYEGGYLGYNLFNADLNFDDVLMDNQDTSYYTELYRQQFHYSQMRHWNNDPNGLVYYQGYYHLYYQHNPFSKTWGDMYWGHARSKDLAHWEELPICLFPDSEAMGFGPGNGYMWSGSARVYHKGDSEAVDQLGWFSQEDGLIAAYTRDGGLQDQVIMSSDDGGMTWTKRIRIPQTIIGVNEKMSCRDPKMFTLNTETGKIWGMTVSGMETNDVWFLKSTDLMHWELAGHFNIHRPECVDVFELTADDTTTHTIITFSSREYIVGELSYDATSGNIIFTNLDGNDISNLTIEEINASKMEYGPDSYAAQSFYIDDPASKYYGKVIGLSWFSGVPGAASSVDSGAFQAVRKNWNGSGFTIPVEYGLKKTEEGYLLTQTPIVKDSSDFVKTEVIHKTNISMQNQEENVLKNLHGHQFEIEASIDNPNRCPIEFKLNMSDEEYTLVGWNAEEGYYVDRSHCSDGGLNVGNYHARFTSGPTEGTVQDFYILSDHGGVEVFCEGFSIPFYVLTLANIYANDASLEADDSITIKSLQVNTIESIWNADINTGQFYVDKTDICLDLMLTTTQDIIAYSTTNQEIQWQILEGDCVDFVKTETGGRVIALKEGKAILEAVANGMKKEIKIQVLEGKISTDIPFDSSGRIAGNWYMTKDGIIGSQPSGDGYLLSTMWVKDFNYSATFDLGTGAAAALIFRAKEDLSDYLIANYDQYGKVVKLWSPRGEIAQAIVSDIDSSQIELNVKAFGQNIQVYINGNKVIDKFLSSNEATEGYLGLNVCATEAIFKAIKLNPLLEISQDYIKLDSVFHPECELELYYNSLTNDKPTWNLIEEGNPIVQIEETEQGLRILPVSKGKTILEISFGEVMKQIPIEVLEGVASFDIEFKKDNYQVGAWFMSEEGLIGQQPNGDGFLLSDTKLSDVLYTISFDLRTSAAAALVLRASADMKNYLIANYDRNANVVKLWSSKKEYGNVHVGEINPNNITLSVSIIGKHVDVLCNGKKVISIELDEDEPTEGYLGVNVFAGEVLFKVISLTERTYSYKKDSLTIQNSLVQHIKGIYNVTLNNRMIDSAFYEVSERNIIIYEDYFKTLPSIGDYVIRIVGEQSNFEIIVKIEALPEEIVLVDRVIEEGTNLVVYIGNSTVETLKLDGEVLTDYVKDGYSLSIDSSLLKVGKHQVEINGVSFEVEVIGLQTGVLKAKDNSNLLTILLSSVFGGLLFIGGGVTLAILLIKRRKRKNGSND